MIHDQFNALRCSWQFNAGTEMLLEQSVCLLGISGSLKAAYIEMHSDLMDVYMHSTKWMETQTRQAAMDYWLAFATSFEGW